MATINIPEQSRKLTEAAEIREFLEQFGIWYRRFEGLGDLAEDASDEEVLACYNEPIETLMEKGGYRTADVINVHENVPGLQAMLDKFNKEHWHDEDEVRFIVRGRGLFHINPGEKGPVFAIEVEKGDMINVPRGTHHWFDLCHDRNIRAIRLFQDTSGWAPHYTETKVEADFQPLCFGPQYFPPTQEL